MVANRILIVNDNPDIAYMLREKIAHYIGGDIETAPDGRACLETIRDNQPDLVLLDICMPAMDGFEICRLLRENPDTADLPVIFLSATYDDLRNRIKGLELGADDYLVQPVDDLALITRVKTLLHCRNLAKTTRLQSGTINDLRQELERVRREAQAACRALLDECGNEEGTRMRNIRDLVRKLVDRLNLRAGTTPPSS